jgi:flagellar biosynthesis component FlhA
MMMMFDLTMLGCFPGMGTMAMMKMSMVMSALGSAVSFVSQMQAANEKKKWQEHNADIAERTKQQKDSAVIAQHILNKEATARQQQAAAQEGDAAIADAKASMISGGVAGLSMEHLLSNIEAQKGQYQFALGQESEMRAQETERQLKYSALATEGQLAQIHRPIDRPNPLAFGIEMAGNFANQRVGYLKELEKRTVKQGYSFPADPFSYNWGNTGVHV